MSALFWFCDFWLRVSYRNRSDEEEESEEEEVSDECRSIAKQQKNFEPTEGQEQNNMLAAVS